MAERRRRTQAAAPPGRLDYLPDSRILTAADKAERRALFKAFGTNLWRARSRAGVTQRELAVRAEFSRASVVSQFERGKRPPNLVQLVMLAHALGVPCEELLADLPVPLRERSTQHMLALVRKHPGIGVDELAGALLVKPSYVVMVGARLSLEGRLTHDRRRFWPCDQAEERS